jgi:predicted glycosyl hydrolase (DUF1957 family)
VENLKIGLLLHFYQPWWQFPAALHKITNQCYRPILRLVNSSDRFCFTANVNLSLLELLDNNFPDVIEGFRKAAEKGKIELMSSPAQHPIFPLIPEFLQRAQIQNDQEDKEKRFALKQNCKGFYFPEMAFSRNDIGLMKEFGYRWSVTDDEPFRAIHGSVPYDNIVIMNGFKTYMRSSLWSNLISSGNFSFADIKARMEYEISSWTKNTPAYIIIAMDAETFGHHHEGFIERFLKPMFKEWGNEERIVPIESLEQNFPWRSISYLPDGSWSTSADDVRKNDPYPLWNSRFNKYHSMLWELTNIALKYFKNCEEDCLKMTSSCHWWWISGRPYWEPEFMKFGAKKAMEIIREYSVSDEKRNGENLYKELKELH